MALTETTKRYTANLPAEAAIVRKIVRTLKAAGTPVVQVHDGEEFITVKGEEETLEAVFAVDMARLYTADGRWVLIILGNGWDALSDYSVSLEDILTPVQDWIETKS